MNFTKSLLYSLTVSICIFTVGCNSSKNENVKQEKKDVKTENKLTADVKPSTPETTHVTKENKPGEQVKQKLPLYASISASKMNVCYIGVDNPIEVTVPNVPSDQVILTATNGTILRSKNGYIFRPKRPGTSKISAFIRIEGESKLVRNKNIRVLSLPTPTASVMNSQGGVIARNVLMAASGVNVRYSDSFPFEARFNVISFTISATVRGYQESLKAKGARFTLQQKQLLKNMKKGSLVFIHDIKAKGPDQSVRSLGALAFRIK